MRKYKIFVSLNTKLHEWLVTDEKDLLPATPRITKDLMFTLGVSNRDWPYGFAFFTTW